MEENKPTLSGTRKLTFSGIVIALYVVLMFITQNFAFGQYQIRIATSLYALASVSPFLIVPLGIANFLSNTIMGGLGPLDMFGGFVAGILTSAGCYFIGKISKYLTALPIMIIPTLLVPIWLSYLLKVPYSVLALSLGIGQIIPGIVGAFLAVYYEKHFSGLMGGRKYAGR